MEDIKCILCNESSENIVIEENGYKGRKCPKCGLIFISPRPTQAEIIDIYAMNIKYAKSHRRNDYAGRLTANNNIKIINKFKKNGSLLEIGSGSGHFLDEARKAGYSVCGIELNKYEAEFINNTFNIICENTPLSSSSFGNKKFDIIYHRDVFSHLFDPLSMFSTMNHKLNGEGIMVFETGILGDADQKYFNYFNNFEYPGHLFFLSRESLAKLLVNTGFELQDIFIYSLIPKLLFRKLTGPVVNRFNNRAMASKSTAGELDSSNAAFYDSNSGVIDLLKDIYLYLDYYACYKIGKIAPKERRPQTCVIVAKKIDRAK